MKRGQSLRRKGCMRLPAALVLSSLLTLVLGAGTAHAARGLTTGFADPLFESPNQGERALWLDRTVSSGANSQRSRNGKLTRKVSWS